MNSAIANACTHSVYLTRILDAALLDENQLENLIDKPLDADYFTHFAPWSDFQAAQDENALAKQLRRLRHLVLAHIMVRDINRLSNLAEVTNTISHFADFAVNQALLFAHEYCVDLYGTPLGRHTQNKQYLSVIAMGKMGGFELNVSSDIDLIFVFPENGDTNGKRSKSNQEFFTKVGQKLIALLNDITADGQVFRVDMRLRPNGDSGPLVLSETALEQYLITQGREWERYAWIKARIITPYDNDIAALTRPFVYRKYLDFNAYEAMRDLHRKIQVEVNKKGMAENIKLGAGGIREIEFIAQIFQLIRGGQVHTLQKKGTQETLLTLAELDFLPKNIIQKLLKAYRFLRDVEHRLQYWDDQQTQTLPENKKQQSQLAISMGFTQYPSFLEVLQEHRQQVNHIFKEILSAPPEKNEDKNPFKGVWQDELDEEEKYEILNQYGYLKAHDILKRLHHMRSSGKYTHLNSRTQKRFDALIPQILAVSSQFPPRTQTLFRLLDFIDIITRRSSYLALLHEHPESLRKLAELMSQSEWISQYLLRHPILLDELLSAQLMNTHCDWQAAAEQLHQALLGAEDFEEEMDIVRHFQHAATFHLAAQDLAGLWTIEAISDELSALADMIIQAALTQVWQHLNKKHCATPHFAVLAYGKLGGKELAYSSDLDLVYLYDDTHPDAAQNYSRFANRLTSWLSAGTAAGILYDVDLRLRPNGEAGFLACTIDMFHEYQQNQAWTWEHQAISRARFVGGDAAIGKRFNAIREEILTRKRDLSALRTDIINMRTKILHSHPSQENDVKYARGGVVDVEFIVQFLVLAYSNQYIDFTLNHGNIALLGLAVKHQLIPADLGEYVQAAYRHYRQVQHSQSLQGTTIEADNVLRMHYANVCHLWEKIMQQNIMEK